MDRTRRKKTFFLIVGSALIIVLLNAMIVIKPVQSDQARFVITNFSNGRRIWDTQLNIVCYNTYYESDPGRLWCIKLEMPIDKTKPL